MSALGKTLISIGSAPGCDVVLAGPGVSPEHARITKQPGGLVFVDLGVGPSFANGAPVARGASLPFDFHTQFAVGQVPVPNAHSAIARMLMHRGDLAPQPGQIVLGRENPHCHVVLENPSVSARHATVTLNPLTVTDHGSTTGTWVGRNRLPANQPVPLDPNSVLAVGPVPVPVAVLLQLAQEIAAAGAFPAASALPVPAGSVLMPPGSGAVPPGSVHLPPGSGPIPPGSVHLPPGSAPIPPGSVHLPPSAAPIPQGSVHLPPGAAPIPQGSVHLPPGAVPGAPGSPPAEAPPGGGGPGQGMSGTGLSPALAMSGIQQPRRKHKTVIGQVAMAGAKPFQTIGRTPDNDIVVPHPQVSSKHAVLHMAGSQLFLEDRGSSNGSYVRGQRIPPGQRVPVAHGEKVFIGPMPLLLHVEAEQLAVVVEDQAQWAGRPLYEIEAWDLVIMVPDRDNPSVKRTLLDHVSFKAMPGDLIALMGPSGAGKTTLLLTLNGYLPPTAGQVRINGEDLYAIYDALRGSIGYVPQDDIVHPELTVWEAVRYSAKFRLPPDYSEEEIDRRVELTLAQLGLENVRHLQIGKPEKKILSGGQRKRVNIAMELVTDPIIMFLDEPTSGLAADDTTALVQLLADLAKQTGKTIITTIHQPAKDEFEKFNLALVLGQGGIPIFYGPTRDGYKFFGSYLERQGMPNTVDNPRDMFDMLNQRERPIWDAMRVQNPNAPRFEARQAAAREWHAEFFAPTNPFFQKMYSGVRSVGTGAKHQGVPHGRPKTSGQFFHLLGRYFRTKVRDVGGILIMLAQAPIIGLVLALVFGWQKEAIPYWCLGALQELGRRYSGTLDQGGSKWLEHMTPTADNAAAVFFLVVAAIWFGTSNAAREIVSERAIYTRERMVNLKLFNYVFSKFLLLSVFSALQCTVLLGIVFFTLGFHGGPIAFAVELAILVVTSMNSVSLGLLLSTMVSSSEAAMALTPIALIPQILLGGLMVPQTTNSLLQWPMYVVPARWGFQGVVAQERMSVADDKAWIVDLGKPDLNVMDSFIQAGKFHCAEAQIAAENLNGAWGFAYWDQIWQPPAVLLSMMMALLVAILFLLKRRDSI
jgi:ABC transport system ATP-binding/permease protein